MNRHLLPAAFGAVLMLLPLSCAKEDSFGKAGDSSRPSYAAAKIIGNPAGDVVPDELVFRVPRGAQACGALARVSAVSEVVSIRPVFHHFPGKEDMERRFGLDEWFVATLSEGVDLERAAFSVAGVPEVRTVRYNELFRSDACGPVRAYRAEPQTKAASDLPFNDPSLADQWHYINTGDTRFGTNTRAGADVNVKDAWRLCAGDPSIIVAVIDEAVKYTHPDLAANMWTNAAELNGKSGVDDDGNGYVDDIYGYNFAENGALTWGLYPDDSGHGTHCAGTIAAVNNNNTGVCGIAGGSGKGDGVRLMSCQTMVNGGATSTATAAAIQYAAAMGASVISCSFGTPGSGTWTDADFESSSSAQKAALDYFEASRNNDVLDGGVAVFGAGNEGLPAALYPGAYHSYICVSAFAPDYLPAYYTNYSAGCSVCAPGGEYAVPGAANFDVSMVLSTLVSEIDAHYGYMQGTSMACPHVSGIVALALSYAKKLGKTFTLQQFKDMVITSVNEMDSRLIGMRSYLNGTKSLDLGRYRKKLGSGAIDTWKLFMQIEGTPCLQAKTGARQRLDLKEYFGGGAQDYVTYLGEKLSSTRTAVEISAADKEALGLQENPYIEYGKLVLYPTKPGSAKITIRAIGAGDTLGGGESHGGMEISKTVSIISRPFSSKNNGWM